MKKFSIQSLFLAVFLFVTGTAAFAQTKSLQVFRDGSVIYSESVSQIDSILFDNVLAAPANVTATLDNDAIHIQWSSVSGATQYEVYRSGDNSTYALLAGNITATSCTDNAPLDGTNYYKVKALNATLGSALSAASAAVSFSGDGSNKQVYVGVVAFNSDVSVFPISNDMVAATDFISGKTNDIDRTALCYAISKSVTLFDAQNLPSFDKIFVVSFTDGIDNGSSSLYVRDGRQITQARVYDAAHDDLTAKNGLDAYTIGFGDQPLAASMQKLIIGKGAYKQSNSSTLNATFQEIAQSVIASSKNVVLRTQGGFYTEEEPKYVKLTVTTSAGLDVIIAKIVGYTLSIVTPGTYTSFDAPVTGTVSSEDSKIEIPLNNLKFVRDGTEYPFTMSVQVSYDNSTYYTDTEDTSAEEAIGKKIAVVLVLDCSTSLGSNFAPMQTAANNFINTLATQVGTGTGGGGGNNNSLTETVAGVSFDMIAVEGGTFAMGETGVATPVHNVTLSNFAIGKYEVTQGLWKAVMGSNPSYFTGNDNLPVEQVSWSDATAFIAKLNELTGKAYRLPTEAEWEYAARGGKHSQGYMYSGGNDISGVAWYDGNSGSITHAVGQKTPNELGIYDLSGNVWEWCYDWYGSYSSSSQTDPQGASSGSARVDRGGGWHDSSTLCRVSYRYDHSPGYRDTHVGFRLARSL
jgi:formylglycine-generating enzyme required for sulfatase activity